MNIQATLSLASRNYIHFMEEQYCQLPKRSKQRECLKQGRMSQKMRVIGQLQQVDLPIFAQYTSSPMFPSVWLYSIYHIQRLSQHEKQQEYPCLFIASQRYMLISYLIQIPHLPQKQKIDMPKLHYFWITTSLQLGWLHFLRQRAAAVPLGSLIAQFKYLETVINSNIQRQLMKQLNIAVLVLVLALVPTTLAIFDLTIVGINGSIYQTVCNPQTTLEFQFSSSSTVGVSQASSIGLSSSQLRFLDVNGNDLVLPLTNFALDSNASAKNFVKGYGYKFSTTSYVATISGAYLFQFSDGTNIVYVYIPVTTTTGSIFNVDVIDLSISGGAVNNFVIPSSGTTVPLTPFNMVDDNTYNQWYTSNVGTSSILVSSFIYKIPAANVGAASTTEATWQTTMLNTNWSAALSTNSAKLCYASTITTGNFQTHLRESVPLWFIWFWTFFYWLYFLISDSINVKVYDRHFENNKWTNCSFYSLYHLAHEEYFTRLSRTTILFINWTIQGVFIASIYGNNMLGAPMIIWTAVIAFVATIPVPFIFGYAFLKKTYDKCLLKYDNMKAMKGVFDKSKIQPLEQAVDTCEEKLYGYYHWYYSLTFVIYFICWPIAVNQMQKLSRVQYYYHWYWLASMGIVFALEHFIYEPLLALLFGDREFVRNRGGFFYNFKLGEDYRAAQAL